MGLNIVQIVVVGQDFISMTRVQLRPCFCSLRFPLFKLEGVGLPCLPNLLWKFRILGANHRLLICQDTLQYLARSVLESLKMIDLGVQEEQKGACDVNWSCSFALLSKSPTTNRRSLDVHACFNHRFCRTERRGVRCSCSNNSRRSKLLVG